MLQLWFVLHVLLALANSLTPNVWPLPSNFSLTSEKRILSSNFFFDYSEANYSVVVLAVERYSSIIFSHNTNVNELAGDSSAIVSLRMTVKNKTMESNNPILNSKMDESYKLQVNASGNATLESESVWGILRGLETFSQIVVYNFTANVYQCMYTGVIEDKPRFIHRGILLDTSRHFQTIKSMQHLLNAMSFNKLNVLHWHIVDAEAFPFKSNVYPLLSSKGAYSTNEEYLQTDIIPGIIQYAYNLGIRVIIEFDMPGHTGSWCLGYPEICPDPACVEEERETNVNNIPLNPASNLTYEFVRNLYSEALNNVYIDDYVHLGGDETVTYCWTQTPSIVEWMNENHFTTADAYNYFILRTHSIIANMSQHSTNPYHQNQKVINWVEAFQSLGTSLPFGSVIQVWESKSTLQEVVSFGYDTILSNSDSWYLNDLLITWQKMYLNEPFENITDPAQQSFILGGEACMWGEYVDNSNVINTIFPRASAVAEKLWSNYEQTQSVTKTTSERLRYFRCLMNQRGVAAGPTDTKGGASPNGPDSCYQQ